MATGRTAARTTVAALSAALVAGFLGGSGVAGAEPSPLAPGIAPNTSADVASLADKLGPRLRDGAGATTVFVELDRPAAVDTYNAQRRAGASSRAAADAAGQTKDLLSRLTNTVVGRLRALDDATSVLYRTSNAIPGFAVRADAAQLRELARRDDVRSVRSIVPKHRGNASADQLTRTLNSWQQTGRFGEGVSIGIIDDGVDYTHADFGGPGTEAAYEAIDRTTTDPAYFPTKKVLGGTDFSGDDYTGSAGSMPKPDPNPLSCGSHGTHVAGTAAGTGVTQDGKSFDGDYAKLTAADLDAMKIGPGSAPAASLYAFKVFGCEGSTALVGQAMDRALDPNNDDDFSDHVDIVNMSLGGDFAAPDDPDAAFVRKLVANGVLPVVSSGNAGDVYDAGGAPGNSVEALTVASSRDAGVLRDAIEVTAPSAGAGMRVGQYSEAFEGYDTLDRTRPVVKLALAANADGCAPYSAADRAAVTGKFVWLEWDDNDATRKCGSAVRANNAEAAGAQGVLLSSGLEQFTAGIAGNAKVPQFQLTGPATEALRPALNSGQLQVRFAGALRTSVQTSSPGIVDTPSAFTSRGVRGPAVKPDISAPGDSITSALSGSGSGRLVLNGTSMSAPHTAGIAALLREARPDWTPEELKAGLMNTANGIIRSGANGTGRVLAPQRVGAGRIDALAALSNQVLAMVQDDPGAVSVSFGTVEASGTISRSKTVKLVNKTDAAVRYNAVYRASTKLPGVSYRLSSGAITVPANGTATMRLTLQVDRAALRKLIDPTMQTVQAGQFRQFLADASGNLMFVPAAGSALAPLRVPVYAAPKPVADVQTPAAINFASGRNETAVRMTGRGLDQGSGAQRYASLISPLQLQARSPELPPCTVQVTKSCVSNGTAKASDLRYVGATSTAPQGGDRSKALLGIGVATWGDWYNIGSNASPFVQFDVDGDDKPDFETSVGKLTATDVLVASTIDVRTKAEVDVQPINGQFGNVDTNVFDTNVIVLPVRLGALGIAANATTAPLRYTVGVSGFYAPPGSDSSTIDSISEPLRYDPLKPALWTSGAGSPALTFAGRPNTSLVLHRDQAAAASQDVLGLLTLNLQNAKGNRASTATVNGVSPAAQAGLPPGDREFSGTPGDREFYGTPGDREFYGTPGDREFYGTPGDREFSGAQPLGDREFYGDRPLGDREFYGAGPLGDREFYSVRFAGDREFYSARPLGDREFYGDRPLGDREFYSVRLAGDREFYGDGPLGDREFYGDRPLGDREFRI